MPSESNSNRPAAETSRRRHGCNTAMRELEARSEAEARLDERSATGDALVKEEVDAEQVADIVSR